jgi:DNA (cytosine-5)-methyltransferase 1
VNKKPIRLIELFAGIGTQYQALKRIGADVESYLISDWNIPSNIAYRAMLKAVNDIPEEIDYTAGLTRVEVEDKLIALGLSLDGKNPLLKKTLKRKNEKWQRDILNSFYYTHNLGSITNIHAEDLKITEKDKYDYYMTYSFPCQDLSLAGKQAGMKKGSGTRSGLLWEVERLLQESTDKGLELPDVLLMENVPQVCSGKNKEDFEDWKNFLSSLGYKNFVKILDAADFEVPQSRKRCFMVSILKDVSYEFPEAIPLTRCVDDILETDVDEKYYINTPKAKELIQSLIDRGELSDRNVFCADGGINNPKIKSISNCITARQDRGISNRASEGNVIVEKKPIQLGNIMEENGFKNPQCGRVYDKNACSPTLNTCNGGNHEPKIIVDDIYNSREARIYKEYSPALRANRQGFKTIVAMRGRPVCNPNLQIAGLPTKQRLEINKEGISNTLTTVQKDNLVLENIIYDDYNNNIQDEQSRIGTITPTCGNSALRNGKKIIERVEQISSDNSQCGTVVSDEGLFPTLSAGCHGYANPHIYTQYRVRKLTPKECGRLMGVDDAVIDSMGKVLSNSKLYQCFGNAIVVDVLCAIFSQLEIIREK